MLTRFRLALANAWNRLLGRKPPEVQRFGGGGNR